MPPLSADLTAFLSAAGLLEKVGPEALRRITESLELLTVAPGNVLIEQGSLDDALYLILSGTLAVTAEGPDGSATFLSILAGGSTAGGWSLMTGDASLSNVVALEPVTVARFSKPAFEAFNEKYPKDAEFLLQALARDRRRSRLQLALYGSQLFGQFDELALRDLENEFELQTFRGGEVLLRQGETGSFLYVVVSGRLGVVLGQPGGESKLLAELGVGEIVGEMGMITLQPRAATVYAIRDTQAARLSREGFDRFVLRHPQTAVHTFTRQLALRLSEQLSGKARPNPEIRTVAVIAAGADVPVAEFAERLTAVLSTSGSTLHLSGERVDALLEQPGIAHAPEASMRAHRLMEWLNKQEGERDYLTYECDAAPTAWTERCLRNADRILIVANAGSDPGLGEIEQKLLSNEQAHSSAKMSLVLLHPEGARPSGTAKWLAPRHVDRHHHVRMNSTADFERLARHLLGRAFGLTLGGGFARGMVHCGVLRALQETGIAIDAIGGNSMGALMAAEWALGWNPRDMLERTSEGCARCLKDMTLPLIAFKSGGKFGRLVMDFIGDTRIEDLWVPYFCVSANLNRAELKVHTEGELAKAILASTRVPGVFPPIVYDGELHVDGGLLNNVPVDVMRRFTRGGLVMGVDAVPERQFESVADYGYKMTGWRALWNRFNPFSRAPRIPSIILLMLRTMEFGGVSRKRSLAEAADLYLRPPLQGIKPIDFTYAHEIDETGYRTALEGIEGWLNNAGIPAGRKPMVSGRRPSGWPQQTGVDTMRRSR